LGLTNNPPVATEETIIRAWTGVRLLDLANAYATLARGGVYLPVRPLRKAIDTAGRSIHLPASEPRRVMPQRIARLVTDILADPNARLGTFGPNSSLRLPFPVAAKTGTSKGFRDNIAVGYTPRVTVAVWVGNFDGSSMQGVSGVTGAGPLFHRVMKAAHRRYDSPDDRFAPLDAGFEHARICTLSGLLATEHCPHRRREVFLEGTKPTRTCDIHQTLRIDKRNGLLAGRDCPEDQVEEVTFERFPSRFRSWAKAAHRHIPPARWSPL
jgi:penicillin-binding protein 1C